MKATVGTVVTILTGVAPQISKAVTPHVARMLPIAVIHITMEDFEAYCRIGSYMVSMGVGVATFVFMVKRKRLVEMPERPEVEERRRPRRAA